MLVTDAVFIPLGGARNDQNNFAFTCFDRRNDQQCLCHHPLGGAAPETMLHGFLSGVGHPLIGFDHLAFVVAIGVLAAFQTQRLVMPLGFVMGTVIGSLLTLAAVTLPLDRTHDYLVGSVCRSCRDARA